MSRTEDDLDIALREEDPVLRRRGIEGFIHEMKRTIQDRTRVYGQDDEYIGHCQNRLAVAEEALAKM